MARLAPCRTHKIPWLTTQIILVRAPSKQTRRQPFCAAARPRRPSGPSAAWRRRFTRARSSAFLLLRKKSAAGPATALVGAPCNKRVLRGWSRLFVASVLPLAWRARTLSRRVARHQRAGNGSLQHPSVIILRRGACGVLPSCEARTRSLQYDGRRRTVRLVRSIAADDVPLLRTR